MKVNSMKITQTVVTLHCYRFFNYLVDIKFIFTDNITAFGIATVVTIVNVFLNINLCM